MTHALSKKSNMNESGNVLFYILICVALLGALSYVMSRGASDSASGMVAQRISEEIKSQSQSIRAAILECNLVNNFGYPKPVTVPLNMRDLECQKAADPDEFEFIFRGTSNRVLPLPPKPFASEWQYNVVPNADPAKPDTITMELSQSMNCDADAGMKSGFNILQSQFTPDEVDITCDGTQASFIMYIVKADP